MKKKTTTKRKNNKIRGTLEKKQLSNEQHKKGTWKNRMLTSLFNKSMDYNPCGMSSIWLYTCGILKHKALQITQTLWDLRCLIVGVATQLLWNKKEKNKAKNANKTHTHTQKRQGKNPLCIHFSYQVSLWEQIHWFQEQTAIFCFPFLL